MKEPEISQLLSLLDEKVIVSEIETYIPDHKVTKVHIKSTEDTIVELRGGFDLLIKIDLEDVGGQSQSWFMRIRKRSSGRPYPDEVLRMNLESEVATCQALFEGGVDVPQTFPRPGDSKQHPKLIYCYQSFIPGDAWPPFDPVTKFNDPPNPPVDYLTLNHIKSVAKWFIQLEKVQFDKIGSPSFDTSGKIMVGPLVEGEPTKAIPPYFDGPFTSLKERYLNVIDSKLRLLRNRELVGPDSEIYSYLVLLELREIVENVKELEKKKGPFYVRHADDHSDHCRATEDGEVMGVIDWEWAYTTSKEEAFSSPDTLLPRVLSRTDDDHILTHREEALIQAYESLNRPDLAECVREGRKYSRLMRCLHHAWASIHDIRAMRKGFKVDLVAGEAYPTEESKEDWVERMKLKYADDEGLKWVLDNPVFEPELPEECLEVK
nr:uncharacterized protein I203_02742 [Kwoniella mangroviensis CBS 8507]OCF68083.1 hypothetical protein I203_02742 [Kwoniella mangroviensis CBS 8507]